MIGTSCANEKPKRGNLKNLLKITKKRNTNLNCIYHHEETDIPYTTAYPEKLHSDPVKFYNPVISLIYGIRYVILLCNQISETY